jgi:hypothetical protein
MSGCICATCGKITNTAVSNYWDNRGGKATECYAAYVDGKWVKGCGYDKADPEYQRPIIDAFLKRQEVKGE